MADLYPLPFKLRLLFFYNSVAATLWICCFFRFLILLPLVGRKFLPGGIADFFHVVSVLPLGEVLLKRIVRSRRMDGDDAFNLFTGVRMAWLCYCIIFQFPKIAKHTSYSLLIASWCITWSIHFTYNAFMVKVGGSPYWLQWLQYSNFYLTYPISCVAEIILIFLSLKFVENSVYDFLLQVVIVSYIPLGYFTWNYLQNRRVAKLSKATIAKVRPAASVSSTAH